MASSTFESQQTGKKLELEDEEDDQELCSGKEDKKDIFHNIKTFLFINIGVTGTWEENYTLSRVKLCIKPVNRDDLLTDNVDLHEDIRYFLFEPIDTEYEEFKELIKYDLVFNQDTCQELLNYIASFKAPVALLSYNGFRKNFPIIRGALGHLGYSLPDGIRCADLMQAFYEIENNMGALNIQRDSGNLPWDMVRSTEFRTYSFPDVYTRVTGRRYDLTSVRPIRQADNEPGIVVPHIKMSIQCCIALGRAFERWIDTPSSTTVFNNGTRLPHEFRRGN